MAVVTLPNRQASQVAAIYIRTSSEHQAEKASPEPKFRTFQIE